MNHVLQKLLRAVGGVFACMLLVLPAHALAAESIASFDSKAVMQADASVTVTETIQYDFGDESRHGIYREIPVSYATPLGKASIKLTDIRVSDEKGAAYMFGTSISGGTETIKIGDPDVLVRGVKTYVLTYTAKRAIGYFSGFDELYWNGTGNGWEVPILRASEEIVLPKGVSGAMLKAACYEGPYGDTAKCGQIVFGAQGEASSSITEVSFAASKPLEAGEGLTAAVGFPKGIVYEPTAFEKFMQVVSDNWIVGVPIIAFIFMFLRWYLYGRDPKGTGVVIAEYESPDELTPLEISAVMHGYVKKDAISAEIIYLATRGYLKITRIEEKGLVFTSHDYVLTKLKDSAGLPMFDELLMDGIFTSEEVKLSDLKNVFYKNMPGIKSAALNSAVAKKYFRSNPQAVRGWYVVGGVVLGFLTAALPAAFGGGGLLAVLSAFLTGGIIVLFGLIMPSVTKEGALVKEKIKGLTDFITVAEKDRISFHNAPEKNPALFEKLLPFAMVVGAEAAWAKQFEGIYMTPPGWYSDQSGGAFNAGLFANNIHAFSSSAASALSSAPGGSGSGGGGFSGGGGGGGGGGSW